MTAPLSGIRVVEVASWTFVPAAGAILADLGADVVKVEPPSGDPQRGLVNRANQQPGTPNPFTEIPNRGKRSITLDLGSPAGQALLRTLVEQADVFLTSYLPSARRKLAIDADELLSVNPRLVYVRGSGWGSRGPMADTGAYDLAAGWATSGLAHVLSPEGGEPPMQPAAFFDLQGANTIAGAVGIALFNRERTGQGEIVDVSLMNVGMWAMGPDIVGAPYAGLTSSRDRTRPANPITNWYRTADGRWLYLVCLQAGRFWAEVCRVVGRPELATDPRFTEFEDLITNRSEAVAELDAAFAERTLDQWKDAFTGFSGVWAPVQSPLDVHHHPQIDPNGFLAEVDPADGPPFRIVAPPMQFGGEAPTPQGPAPELGRHTQEVLSELGLDDEAVAQAAIDGAFG